MRKLITAPGESRELESPAPGNPNPPEQNTTGTTDDHSRTKGNRPNRGQRGRRNTNPRTDQGKRPRIETGIKATRLRNRKPTNQARTRKPAKDDRTQDKEGNKHRREQGEPHERQRQTGNPTNGHTGNPAPPQARHTREKTDKTQHERNPQTRKLARERRAARHTHKREPLGYYLFWLDES